jgi:hypothetical protein
MDYLIIAAVLLGAIPGIVASTKGKSFLSWWIYGCAVFPIALVHSIIAKADQPPVEGSAMLRALKSIGITVAVVCVAVVMFGILAIVLIVQHGGA